MIKLHILDFSTRLTVRPHFNTIRLRHRPNLILGCSTVSRNFSSTSIVAKLNEFEFEICTNTRQTEENPLNV